MKYYATSYPDENGNDIVETLSEKEILDEYWDYWYSRACRQLGKEHIDANYTIQDCIDDWVTTHWAILVDSF